jgi:hypothetical protein
MNCRFLVNNGDTEAEARHLPFSSASSAEVVRRRGHVNKLPLSRSVRMRPVDNVSNAAPDRFLSPRENEDH